MAPQYIRTVTLLTSTHLLKDNSSEKQKNRTVATLWLLSEVYGVFPHRFVFVVVKASALERLLFLLLVPEREDVGTQAALCARFVTISW